MADVVGGHEIEPRAEDVGKQPSPRGPRRLQALAADDGIAHEPVDREVRHLAGGVPDAGNALAFQRALPARARSRQPQPPAGLCTVRSAM